MVHHMLLYECRDDITRQHLNYSGECYGPNMPPAITQCAGSAAVASWAIGGKVSKVQHTMDNLNAQATHCKIAGSIRSPIELQNLVLEGYTARVVHCKIGGSLLHPLLLQSLVFEQYTAREVHCKNRRVHTYPLVLESLLLVYCTSGTL